MYQTGGGAEQSTRRVGGKKANSSCREDSERCCIFQIEGCKKFILDLLDKFTSSRVDAIRSAAQKHNRALKSAQAAAHVTRSDQSQSSKNAKRDENREIYDQSKPKHSR